MQKKLKKWLWTKQQKHSKNLKKKEKEEIKGKERRKLKKKTMNAEEHQGMVVDKTTTTHKETEEGDKVITTQKTLIVPDSQSIPKSSTFTPTLESPTIYALVDKVVQESLNKNALTRSPNKNKMK